MAPFPKSGNAVVPGSRAWERLRRHQSMTPSDAAPNWQANGFGSQAEFESWLDVVEKIGDTRLDEREWERRFREFRVAYSQSNSRVAP